MVKKNKHIAEEEKWLLVTLKQIEKRCPCYQGDFKEETKTTGKKTELRVWMTRQNQAEQLKAGLYRQDQVSGKMPTGTNREFNYTDTQSGTNGTSSTYRPIPQPVNLFVSLAVE